MDEKKLNSLITTLLKMASTQETPNKYNSVITELLKAENLNFVIMDHRGGTVVSYTNGQGGIVMLSDTPAGEQLQK